MTTFAALVASVCAGLAAALLVPGPLAVSVPATEAVRGVRRERSAAGLRAAAALGAALAVLMLVPGTYAVAGSVLAGALVWWRSRRWKGASERRRTARLEAGLPHAVDLLTAALASGAAPAQALDRVAQVVGGPVSEELGAALTSLRLGADPALVWSRLAGHPQLGRLGTTLHRATESGAPVVAALARLAEELRAARRAEVEAAVRQVEVRATVPLAVCLLPAFVLVGIVPLVAGAVGSLVLR